MTASEPIYAGVIENIDAQEKDPILSKIHVRVAFRKTGTDWAPVRSKFNSVETLRTANQDLPALLNWTIVFDGDQIGSISSKDPGPLEMYGDVASQVIVEGGQQIPTVHAGASDFSYSQGPSRARPLLVVSEPNFKDPDGWKPTTLTSAERQLAIRTFRTKFPLLEHCDAPAEKPIHWIPYKDGEIVFVKAYRSNVGEVVFGLRLSDKRSNCEWFDDDNFYSYWYALNGNGKLIQLGSQMMPLDAADFDNGGKSDWVFFTSRGEDEDGYELFYNDFSTKTSFHWTYH